jgi:hypothetical protein
MKSKRESDLWKQIDRLILIEKQDVNRINGWSGNWGYLHLDLVYADETLNLQYAI